MIGLGSSDLADTVTFANGLDEIEEMLNNKQFQEALDHAKEVAEEMVEEEGGGDLFEIKNVVREVVKERLGGTKK